MNRLIKITVLMLFTFVCITNVNADDFDYLCSAVSEKINLNAVWGRSLEDVYAVGDSGMILHFNGTQCIKMQSNTSNNLNSIWGNDDTIFAVGESGTIIYYNGQEWKNSSSGTFNYLNGVWGINNEIYSVGGAGTVLYYNGTTWVEQPSITFNSLNAIWGMTINNVFAVGNSGTIIHFNGTTWSELSSNTFMDLNSIWGNENLIFTVGYAGTVIKYDESSWETPGKNGNLSLNCVWGDASDNVYTVGRNGTIYRYDGTEWHSNNFSDLNTTLNGIWGFSGSQFIVGDGGLFIYSRPTLEIEIETTVTEGDENIICTVKGEANLLITLETDNSKIIINETTKRIAADKTAVDFILKVKDNDYIDGNKTATISASATGWNKSEYLIEIQDDENSSFSVSMPNEITENTTLVGTVSLEAPFAYGNLTVNLVSDKTQELSVDTTVTIKDGAKSTSFNLTAIDDAKIDGSYTVTVTASAENANVIFTSGSDMIKVVDKDKPNILLFMNSEVEEGASNVKGTVSIPAPFKYGDLQINLKSDLSQEISFSSSSIWIPYGSTEREFDLIVSSDDHTIDGNHKVIISASAEDTTVNWVPSAYTVTVIDKQIPKITLSLNEIEKIDESNAYTREVYISAPFAGGDLSVNLLSDNTEELQVSSPVIILKGETSASFHLTGISDNEIDGNQNVKITASTEDDTVNWGEPAIYTVSVVDKETPEITLSLSEIEKIDESNSYTRKVFIPAPFAGGNLSVNLLSDNTGELQVSSPVIILKGKTSASFYLTGINDNQIDGNQVVKITASTEDDTVNWGEAAIYTVSVVDKETPEITLSLSEIEKIDESNSYTRKVCIPAPFAGGNLSVNLLSDNTKELQVSSPVIILKGEISASFYLTGINDNQIDGNQDVKITASTEDDTVNWGEPAIYTVTVVDKETPEITLFLNEIKNIDESNAYTGEVYIPAPFAGGDLSVNIISDNTEELQVSSPVIILKGETSASFHLTGINDNEIDGNQNVKITASTDDRTVNWEPSAYTVTVLDKEEATLMVNIGEESVQEGIPFLGTVSIPAPFAFGDLSINLLSGQPQEISMPSVLAIRRGETSVTFNLEGINDYNLEGDQNISIIVSTHDNSVPWTFKNDSILLIDNNDFIELYDLILVLKILTQINVYMELDNDSNGIIEMRDVIFILTNMINENNTDKYNVQDITLLLNLLTGNFLNYYKYMDANNDGYIGLEESISLFKIISE